MMEETRLFRHRHLKMISKLSIDFRKLYRLALFPRPFFFSTWFPSNFVSQPTASNINHMKLWPPKKTIAWQMNRLSPRNTTSKKNLEITTINAYRGAWPNRRTRKSLIRYLGRRYFDGDHGYSKSKEAILIFSSQLPLPCRTRTNHPLLWKYT